jgi:hypothetical protein
MSCCGSHRSSIGRPSSTRHQAASSPVSGSGHWTPASVQFEYTGQGELTVIGPLTGQVYRFSGAGARILIQGSDVPSMVSVPGLRAAR